MGTIKAALQAIAAFFNFANRRHDAKNAPDVREAVKAQQRVDEKSKIEKAVRDGNDDEYRKQIAE